MQNVENMTFKDYYKSLKNERKEFIKQISKVTGRSERSVYDWINGKYNPDKKSQVKISEYFGKNIHDLFPNLKKTELCE